MKSLPVLFDGDTIYLKDGRTGVFLADCELVDKELDSTEYGAPICNIIQLIDSDEYILLGTLKPEDIQFYIQKSINLNTEIMANVIIKVAAKELLRSCMLKEVS